MSTRKKEVIKKILIVLLLVAMLVPIHPIGAYAVDLQNTDDQYMELKVVSINDVEGAGRQVTMEWWSYNLVFRGLDLRFSYDKDILEPSNLQDNSALGSDKAKSFEFAGDFASYLGYMVITAQNGEYRCNMSLDEQDDTGTYIENDPNLGYVVNTNSTDGVLIGRMSFKLADNAKLKSDSFQLKGGDNTPKTGIRIVQKTYGNYAVADTYEDPSVFRFTLLNNETNLNSIKYDLFNYEEQEGEQVIPELTYKEVDLSNPDEDGADEVSKYTINLNENKDNVSLKLEKGNEDQVIKIGEEEIDVTKSKELTLNKLGEEDTIIDIQVTAADGVTTHTYKLVFHKPYGTLKGKIQLGANLKESMQESYGIEVKYIADITLYKPGDFNWEGIVPGETFLDDLDNIENVTTMKSDDEGNYELYVMPGTYDTLLERKGFLAQIVKNIEINEGDTIELGTKVLEEGDVNRSGLVDLDDLVLIGKYSGATLGDGTYQEQYDIGQKGFVGLDDLVSVSKGMYNKISITEFK